jgi:hypothetical protein
VQLDRGARHRAWQAVGRPRAERPREGRDSERERGGEGAAGGKGRGGEGWRRYRACGSDRFGGLPEWSDTVERELALSLLERRSDDGEGDPENGIKRVIDCEERFKRRA